MKDRRKIEKFGAIIAALAVWQIAAMLLNNSLFLVTPMVVVHKLIVLCPTAEFWGTIGFTLMRIGLGFFLALIFGTLLAIVSGRFRLIETMLFPYIAVVKATPVASFIILCLIWLNSKNLSVFISFLIVLPIVYTNVLEGFKATDPKLLEMASLFEVSSIRRFKYIFIPQIKPYLLSAASVAVGMSWKAGVAAEVIGIPSGSIGEKLYEAKIYLSSGDIFAWTIVIVLISVIFEKALIFLLRSLLSKKESA